MTGFEEKIRELSKLTVTDEEYLSEAKEYGLKSADLETLCAIRLFKRALQNGDISAIKEIKAASESKSTDEELQIPARLMAETFLRVYRMIHNGDGGDFVLYGGRGSGKSSFISLCIIELLVNNPTLHACVFRKIKDTIRDSVYSQILWAIGELKIADRFECRTSPLEIEYLPTGQKIYFRGADKPEKIKSIKPPFGAIGLLWFEELDQFSGLEEIRSIKQSTLRGGDRAYVFQSFNPPRSVRSWVNEYVAAESSAFLHKSSYLDIPPEWLGARFIEDAESLKHENPEAYRHEYLGEAVGCGGNVFQNVEIRRISEQEIAKFDRILYGIDWGWYPDPTRLEACHYINGELYIFGEIGGNRLTNDRLDLMMTDFGIEKTDLIIADSGGEGPKTIADFRARGYYMRGARKGRGSVEHSMKWLSSLKKIVIDPVRAPEAAKEFTRYEYEKAPDGSFISGYPDRDNHSIDAVRYATERLRKPNAII